jgi:hypothetical protein
VWRKSTRGTSRTIGGIVGGLLWVAVAAYIVTCAFYNPIPWLPR